MAGNSFTNWSKVTPRHNAFVQAILQADVHVIGTIRAKQDYVLSEKNGKQVPEKVGLKGVTRDGMDYEFTLVFDLDISLRARTSKDRTQLFFNKPEFIPTADTGAIILKWCSQGTGTYAAVTEAETIKSIQACNTTAELLAIYNANPLLQQSLAADFTARKNEIETSTHNSIQPNFSSNGIHTS